MAEAGVEVATTAVGDRYVLDELRRRGWALGGEQSGHIIDLGFGPSGDGIASALLTLEALGSAATSPSARRWRSFPSGSSTSGRTAAPSSSATMAHGEVTGAIEREGQGLAGRGRVLVRASGTEPLVRVMVEAPSAEETEAVCHRLVALVEATLATGPVEPA